MKIYMMNDKGVERWAIDAVKRGVQEVLGMLGKGTLTDFGLWRLPDAVVDNKLQPYKSVDWYVRRGRNRIFEGSKQLNTLDILAACLNEPWRDSDPHLDIVLVSEDIYSGDYNFVFGSGSCGLGCIISTYRWTGRRDAINCLTTVAIHEFGHVLGLIPEYRLSHIEESLGGHCTNAGCVMRQGLDQNKWEQMTKDRIARGPGRAFCPECLANLQELHPPGS